MYPIQAKGQLWIVCEESAQIIGFPGVALDAWCLMLMAGLHTLWLWAETFHFKWLLHCREGASAPYDFDASLFSGALEPLDDFHWAKQCYIRDKLFGSVTSAASTVILLFVLMCRLTPPKQEICWHPPFLRPKWTLGEVSKELGEHESSSLQQPYQIIFS